MIRRNRIKNKVIFAVIVLGMTILFNEFLVYNLKSFEWSLRKCSDCVTVLIVADPQILGENNENYFGASIARWDSDRYLRKTFTKAVTYSHPDVIVFLGDLMDEGHISNTQYFEKYKRRFDSIFNTAEHIMKIYLPGDNDIGGEEDIVLGRIHERFKFAYTQPDTLTYKSATFFKVNRLTHFIPPAPKDAFLNEYTERNTTNVVLSHMPLFFTPGIFVQNVIKELSPQIIFTGHEHKAMYISQDTATEQFSEIRIIPPYRTPLYQMRLDVGDIHELQIPTCSYRMGVRNMGYGLAYIDTREKTLDFTILWSPDRFLLLSVYIFVGIALILINCILSYICGWYSNRHINYSRVPMI